LSCVALENRGEVRLVLETNRQCNIHHRPAGSGEHLLSALNSPPQQVSMRTQTRRNPKLRSEVHACEASLRGYIGKAYRFGETRLNKFNRSL
jgi:hypothetical protein